MRGIALAVGWPAGLAILLILGSGLLGWRASIDSQHERLQQAFEVEVDHLLARVEQELGSVQHLLENVIARLDRQSDRLGTIDWDVLSKRINHDSQLPVPGGAGLAVPLSSHERQQLAERPDLSSSTTISGNPLELLTDGHLQVVRSNSTDPTGNSIGIDLLASVEGRASAVLARDSGHAVMHVESESADAGLPRRIWLYAPVYAIDTPWSLQDRQSQFVGLVFAPIDLSQLLSRVANEFADLAISARAGRSPLIDRSYRTTTDAARWLPDGVAIDLDLLGQRIAFDIGPTTSFGKRSTAWSPSLWALQSAMSAALLLLVVVHHARRSSRTMEKLSALSAEQVARIAELERNTADLDSFAYVVSHDLRAPLRKLQALGDVLAEEVAELRQTDGRAGHSVEIDECLERMSAQAERMDALIAGIHDFSRATAKEERIETISTRASIEAVATTLGVPIDRLHLHGDFPTIRTWSVRFEQIMANLVGNAFKYHDRPDEAQIDVSVSGFGDYWLFSVRDNGPGIDPKHHERIFEVFEAIKVAGIESSGVGLSIVRKSVENAGGRVTVESSPGAGSVFRFTWPKDVAALSSDRDPEKK